ncbi:MAG: polysaccharide deacetylase family protein [Bacillota bacterium]
MKKSKVRSYVFLCIAIISSLSLSGCEITSIRAEEHKVQTELESKPTTFTQSVVELSTPVFPQETNTYEIEKVEIAESSEEMMEEWEKIANETLKIQHVQDIGKHMTDSTQTTEVIYEIEYPFLYNEAIDFYVTQFLAERKQIFNITYGMATDLEFVKENRLEEIIDLKEFTLSGVEQKYAYDMTYDIYSLPNNEVSIIFYETETTFLSGKKIERIHSLLFDEIVGALLPKEAYLSLEVEEGISKYFEESLRAYILEYFENASQYDGLAYAPYTEIFTEEYNFYGHMGKTNSGIIISFNSDTLFLNEVGAVVVPMSTELIEQLKTEATATKKEETVLFVEKENGELQLPFLRREGEIDSTKPMVALTIDDGPSPLYTPRILSVLEQYDSVATFYDVGSLVDRYPEIVKEQYDSGSELGYHSYNHDNFKTFSAQQIRADMEKNKAAYMKAVGGLPTTFRPPYGAWDEEVLNTVDVALINWSVDTMDWKSRNVNSIMNIIYNEGSLDGKVILMHGIYETSVQAIEILVPYLVEQGYQLVTVSELINERYGVLPQAGDFYGYNEFA